MPTFGPTELIIILVILVVLFGAGRIGKIGGELGQSIREFRKGLSNDDQASQASEDLAKRQ
jgi:sec-independent protein translocase protein TatA